MVSSMPPPDLLGDRRRVLVTGGAGFIAGRRAQAAAGDQVTVFNLGNGLCQRPVLD